VARVNQSCGIVVHTLSIDCAENLIILRTAFFVVLGVVMDSCCDAVNSLLTYIPHAIDDVNKSLRM